MLDLTISIRAWRKFSEVILRTVASLLSPSTPLEDFSESVSVELVSLPSLALSSSVTFVGVFGGVGGTADSFHLGPIESFTAARAAATHRSMRGENSSVDGY